MDIHKKNITVRISGENVLVSLKWYRGANRYNNGPTRYKNKYRLRLILSRATDFAKNMITKGSERSRFAE
jgi:hypothetical protein